MRNKIITLLLVLFLVKSEGYAQSMSYQDYALVFKEMKKEMNRGVDRVFYPIYYPINDPKTWKDSSFFVSVVFHVDSLGRIDNYQILNYMDSSLYKNVRKVFDPFVEKKYLLKYNSVKNKSLSFNIFCYPDAWDLGKYVFAHRCSVTITTKDFDWIEKNETIFKNVIVMPILGIRIFNFTTPPKRVEFKRKRKESK